MAVCYKTPGDARSWPLAYLSVQAPTRHTVTHTALRRLCRQAGPSRAQLLPLHLQNVKGQENPRLLQKQAEGGEAAMQQLARPRDRSRRKAGKGFPGLHPGLMAALGSNPTQVGEP